MAVGPGHRPAVEAEHEATHAVGHRRPGLRDPRQHARALVADPAAAAGGHQARHQVVEAEPVGVGQVADDGAVEDHHRAVRRRLVDQRRQLLEQVPSHDHRRVRARHLDGRGQLRPAVVVLRPDQRRQPGHRVLVGDVEGIQVDAAAPGDHRRPIGQRQDAVHVAPQLRPRPGTSYAVGGRPGVGVPVRVEAQARTGADLEQRDRTVTGDAREGRQQRREPADLVGLRRASEDRRADQVVVREQGRPQRVVRPGRRYAVPACGREDQVRLTLHLREPVDPREHLGVRRDPASPVLEAGGGGGGVSGELGVLRGGLGVDVHRSVPRRSAGGCPDARPFSAWGLSAGDERGSLRPRVASWWFRGSDLAAFTPQPPGPFRGSGLAAFTPQPPGSIRRRRCPGVSRQAGRRTWSRGTPRCPQSRPRGRTRSA